MKRFLTYLTCAIASVITMTSCNESSRKQALLPNISGKAGEVLVVIEKAEWEGAVGSILRDTLTSDCPYLPQPEPLYTLSDVVPSAFTQIFQIHRNIIIVNISKSVTEPGVVFRKDVWARPQCVIQVNAMDSETAAMLIKENISKIAVTLEQAERDRIIANSIKYEEVSIAPVVKEMIGGSPHFPSGYALKKKTDDFIWVTYDTQFVDQSILIYKYPVVEGEDMMSRESIIKTNAKVLEENVPGMFDNTYMMPNMDAVSPVEYISFRGRDFAQLRGLWEVHNDFMGGPFTLQAFYSQDGKEIIAIEAFVYAPKYDKRHYMRQVESIIYSYEWDNAK